MANQRRELRAGSEADFAKGMKGMARSSGDVGWISDAHEPSFGSLGGLILDHTVQRGLTLVAAGMLALITLAVRNSWGIAVDVVSSPPPERRPRGS